MKKIASLATVILVLASLCIYLSGFGRHFVTYAPTVSPEAIAAAHQRGYLEIIVGTIGIALSAALAGVRYSRHRTISIISLGVLALVLVGGLVLFLVA